MPSLLDYMQDMCLGLEFCSRMMGAIPSKARATSHTKMYDSMADGDLDFELPTSTVEKFRKMFMDIRKNAWLSAG
jgi:hypothetical protein